jgi:amidase/aspartyl-tRNA(Asn)/glutamyl-tRNA(Gln) amidotransferase subunit A
MFDVPGWPTRAGSSFLPEVRPTPATASDLVRELGAAGTVLAGKTQLFEFAWGLTGENAHFGDCEHPDFPGRTSGGSSSGSAAAVAAGVVPFAIGTDTGGSVRVPASFCGIFGYRGVPRDAWISDAVPLAPSFDTAGWFTANAADLRTSVAALIGLRTSERVPVGCYLEPPGLDPDVARGCRAAADTLTTPADAATRGQLLAAFAPAAEIYGVLAGAESWQVHRPWAERFRDRYGPLLLERLERARNIGAAQVLAVEPGRQALELAWARYFLSYDFLVMPAVPCPALARADCTQASRLRMLGLTAPVSLAGLPCLALPVALPSGLTAGLQVVVNHPQSPVVSWALEEGRYSSG